MESLMVFENEEFGKVRIVTDNEGKPYFVAKDVAVVLGYKKHNAMYRRLSDKDKIRINPQNNDSYKLVNSNDEIETNKNIKILLLLTTNGLVTVINRCTNLTIEKKRSIIESFRNNGCDLNLIALSRDEIEFLDLLESVLEPFGYNCIRQYRCNGYRIDLYIEDLKVAIEYDENSHITYSYESQEGRQKEIEESLGCRFIRVGDENSHAYNVGLVMRQLLIRNC